MAAFVANYDTEAKPLPLSPEMSPTPSHDLDSHHNSVIDTQPIRRISRLGPIDLTPAAKAGPSDGSRYLYVAVRSGRRPGVYTDWREAELQLLVRSHIKSIAREEFKCLTLQDYPDPVFKTFSTKMAAEAYVNGWNGAGRHSVPVSRPTDLD